MSSKMRIPTVPLLLGLGGLVPFAGLAALLASGRSEALGLPADTVRAALVAYGALIASFLGGIRWGAALREGDGGAARDLILSVAPSLLAWGCFALPSGGRLPALAALIGLWSFVDQDLARRSLAPRWFGRLRAILSTGAALALALGATG